MESELFGYDKGAFTGANAPFEGKFSSRWLTEGPFSSMKSEILTTKINFTKKKEGKMATIDSVTLGIGRTGGKTSEYFDLTATISRTEDEINENRWYILRGYLVERDGNLDSYSVKGDGGLNRQRRGLSDDIIGEIWDRLEIRPSEGTEFHFTRRARIRKNPGRFHFPRCGGLRCYSGY